MRDDISDIAAFYDRDVEDEEARLALHQLEYDLTWRYLTRYLPPAGFILEIGAGTGRYTLCADAAIPSRRSIVCAARGCCFPHTSRDWASSATV